MFKKQLIFISNKTYIFHELLSKGDIAMEIFKKINKRFLCLFLGVVSLKEGSFAARSNDMPVSGMHVLQSNQYKRETWSGEGQLCGKKICLYTGWFIFKNRAWLIKRPRKAEEAANELFVSRFGAKNGIPVQMTFPDFSESSSDKRFSGLCIQMAPSWYVPLASFLKHDNGAYHYFFGESDWKNRVFEGILYWFDQYKTKDSEPIDEFCLLKIIAMQLFLGCIDCHANNIFINPRNRMLLKIDNSLIGEPRQRRLQATQSFDFPSEKKIVTALTKRQCERFKFLRSMLIQLIRNNSVAEIESLYRHCFDSLRTNRLLDPMQGLVRIKEAHVRSSAIIREINRLLSNTY